MAEKQAQNSNSYDDTKVRGSMQDMAQHRSEAILKAAEAFRGQELEKAKKKIEEEAQV